MMRAGRTEQPIFAGSVKNRIRAKDKNAPERLNEARCAAVLPGSDMTVTAAGILTGKTDDGCWYAFYRAMNRMAAAGGEAQAVTLHIFMPEGTDKEELRAWIDRFAELAEGCGIFIADVRSGVSASVLQPVFTVTCIGRLSRECVLPKNAGGLSIIMTKYAGCEGTSILAHERYNELNQRFGRSYLEDAMRLKEAVPAVRDAQAALSGGADVFLYSAGEGGILSALWDLSAGLDTGIEIDLRRIPVRQETVEICEAFSMNPYELHAGGSLLILTDEEENVTGSLENAGIPCACIGRTRNDCKKLLINGENVQCMNRPAADPLLALI